MKLVAKIVKKVAATNKAAAMKLRLSKPLRRKPSELSGNVALDLQALEALDLSSVPHMEIDANQRPALARAAKALGVEYVSFTQASGKVIVFNLGKKSD